MTSRSTTRFATAIAGFALLAASCGGSSSDSAAPVTDAAAEPVAEATDADSNDADGPEASATESTTAVPATLQFTAPLVGGGEIDAATLAGKPTAFWFWAPT